jgi:hypothetical protein
MLPLDGRNWQLISPHRMEQRTLKNVNIHLNINIYSYLETSGGKISDLYLNVVHFFHTSIN